MLRVEFHCHSIFSSDSLSEPADLIATCHDKGIDRLVITDHNSIQGALTAKALDPQLIIVGEEIVTKEGGELLAAYVKEEIPPGLPVKEAIDRLRDQEAFISVSHPFDKSRGKWSLADLLEIAPLVDAIETFNARCFPQLYNRQARIFAEETNLLGTAGSDAHALFELGRGAMLLPEFEDAPSLKIAMKDVMFDTKASSPLVRLTSRYASLRKKLTK
ncbi:MAG: PHP domain-containing protein [Chloroflexi bacterium]|jgi:predicted metal-dependent phosphoesterase TrpH|nr:PHP domain-containing protein [Chloroflexota bacterium]MBT4004152.1 PHP domain-containing protein [Chloroflexota bacterium]MBT4306379.1 PHP domain-containing protein [Chloroflexota bacterium]MBT4532740.1 PHP domain-containing protein [Chloroflexota bacterium]MBT4682988.1 PHP domain-containing protein [Chloroflexota bacterium]